MTVKDIHTFVRDMRDDAQNFVTHDKCITRTHGYGAGYTAGVLAASKKIIRFIEGE